MTALMVLGRALEQKPRSASSSGVPNLASDAAASERITIGRLQRGNYDFAAANADRPSPLLHSPASYRPLI
jgi:hypothetical protein